MIDLSVGGGDWHGWRFGPWGKAKIWRLKSPEGGCFVPSEIEESRQLALEVDYLRMVVRQLREKLAPGSVAFTPEAAQVLRAAADILSDALPRLKSRALINVKKTGA